MGKKSRQKKVRNVEKKQAEITRKKGFLNKNWHLLIISLMVLLPLSIWVAPKLLRKKSEPNDRGSLLKVLDIPAEIYKKMHIDKEDQYWFTGEEGVDEAAEIAKTWHDKYLSLLKQYKDISPLSRRIYQHFHKVVISVAKNNNVYYLYSPQKMLMSEVKNTLMMILVPKSQRHFFHASFFYSRDTTSWDDNTQMPAIVTGTFSIPDGFLPALLYHELGHALRHRIDKAPSSTAPKNSDSFIYEEVEMHSLEYKIMNEYSNDDFSRLLDRIISREGADADEKALLLGIKEADLQEFDRLFGLENTGMEVASLSMSQFVFSLLFHYVDQKMPDAKQAMQRKIQIYRSLSQ